MELKIEPFLPSDVEAICNLEEELFPKEIAISKEQLYAILIHSDVVTFCLRNDIEVVGYLILRIEKIKGYMCIISVAIKKQFTRQGWGSKLLLFAKDASMVIKLDYLLLQIEKTNQQGINFFKKLGFKITKEFKNYLKAKQIGYEMKLDFYNENTNN